MYDEIMIQIFIQVISGIIGYLIIEIIKYYFDN